MKDGVHETRAKPFASWNAQLIEPVVDDLTQEFARYDTAMDKLAKESSMNLCQLIDKISDNIKGELITHRLPFDVNDPDS